MRCVSSRSLLEDEAVLILLKQPASCGRSRLFSATITYGVIISGTGAQDATPFLSTLAAKGVAGRLSQEAGAVAAHGVDLCEQAAGQGDVYTIRYVGRRQKWQQGDGGTFPVDPVHHRPGG